jgi:hypothetical protein
MYTETLEKGLALVVVLVHQEEKVLFHLNQVEGDKTSNA